MRVPSEGETARNGRWHVLGNPFDGHHRLSVALFVLLKLSLAWVHHWLVANHSDMLLNRGGVILVFLFLLEIWHCYTWLVGWGRHALLSVLPVHLIVFFSIIHSDGMMDY